MAKKHRDHILAYVRTSKVSDWKRIVLKHGSDKGPAFVYRSDDDLTFAEYARSGAVLWVMESHLNARPSLVARLQIVGQVHAKLDLTVLETTRDAAVPRAVLLDFEYGRKLRWYAVANPKCSRFFGYNDVWPALVKTKLEGERTPWREGDEWTPKFGQSLERPRLIKSGSIEMEKLAEDLTARSVFLSWKHDDFRNRHDEIRGLVDALVKEGIDCWWDQLALPPSRAVKRLTKHPELLTKLLDYGLSRSKILLALGSPKWGGPSSRDTNRTWTREEWDRAAVRFAYEIAGTPERGWPVDHEKTVISEDKSVAVAVRCISDRLEELRGGSSV